jgi:hypothetical protein
VLVCYFMSTDLTFKEIVMYSIKNRLADFVNFFSKKTPVLAIEGRNNSRHCVKCDWLFLDYTNISVRVNQARIDIWTNGQEQISNVTAELIINRSWDNRRRNIDAIRSGSPAILRVCPDWPWGRPRYDLLINLAEKTTYLFGSKIVISGSVMQVANRESAVILPVFDRSRQQAITLQDIVKLAATNNGLVGVQKKNKEEKKEE